MTIKQAIEIQVLTISVENISRRNVNVLHEIKTLANWGWAERRLAEMRKAA